MHETTSTGKCTEPVKINSGVFDPQLHMHIAHVNHPRPYLTLNVLICTQHMLTISVECVKVMPVVLFIRNMIFR